ncbi:MAG TPA: carboxypeptidase regulatory-like domain-containing protein, partial [Myxococcota bacterium]
VVLDNVPGAGEVRCGPVVKESELIGGPQAFAQVGRAFRCNNHDIRFIIQDGSRPVGTSAEGGNLIDVDLARDDGSGEDTFREHVSAIGAKEAHVEKIEVVKSGADGGDGIIRVTGTPTALTLAPQAYYLSQDFDGELVTDYVLHPDVNYIEIDTTLKNHGDPIPSVQPADFVAFGGSNKPHTPESGFSDVPLFSSVSFLSGARGDKVSYGVVSPDEDIVIPFIDQGTTAPFYGLGVPVGSDHEFTRYFLVGDGSVESTSKTAIALRGLPHGTVTGVVTDGTGAPAANVLVAALNATLDDDNARVVNEARTGADGAYTLTLAPGAYHLLAHAEGRARSAEVLASVDDQGSAVADALVIGATGHVHATTSFTDASGAATGTLPSKLTLVPGADAQHASDVLADFSASGATSYVVSKDGVFDADVPPGSYTAYVTRGFEFSRSQQDITVTADQTTTITASIAHVVDSTGLIGAEFHQHCLGSIDAQVPVPRKVMENAAEGVEFAAATDHDVVTNFQPHVDALGLGPYLSVIPGDEVSYQGIGHFNVYPMPFDDADPLAADGSRLWWYKTVPEMFADVRALAGDPIIQINHPRSSLTGFFATVTLDPTTATLLPHTDAPLPTLPATIYTAWPTDFDAMEVNGNLGDATQFTDDGRAALAHLAQTSPTDVPVLADYFALLGAGMKVAAMGNSDSHHLDSGVGYPRNFLTVNKDDPAQTTGDDAKIAIRAQ